MRTGSALLLLAALAASCMAQDTNEYKRALCSDNYVTALGQSDTPDEVCGAVDELVSCLKVLLDELSPTSRTLAENTISSAISQHPDCKVIADPEVISQSGNLRFMLSEHSDVIFARHRREELSIWDLDEKIDGLIELTKNGVFDSAQAEELKQQIASMVEDKLAGQTSLTRMFILSALANITRAYEELEDVAKQSHLVPINQAVTELVKESENATDRIAKLEKRLFQLESQCIPYHEYEKTPGTDTTAPDCEAITECSEEHFQTKAPTRTSDRVCQLKQVCNTTIEYTRDDGSPFRDRACAPLSVCTDSEYEAFPPGKFSDRQCRSLTSCTLGANYETKAPTPTSDRICTPATTCGAGTREVKAPTLTTDRECAKTISDSVWYEASPVKMWAVTWPAGQAYSESGMVALCKLHGLKPWRDEDVGGCTLSDYVCDQWGFNLGGHDICSKFGCLLGTGTCYGHSGNPTVNVAGMATDLLALGFTAGTDIYMAVKQHHSTTYETTASYMKFRLSSNQVEQGPSYEYNSGGTPPRVDITLCAQA